jgi:cobalt/nickel transport system permease protein
MPWIFVTLLALMYRYLFVLVDEAERMERARRSRALTDRKSLEWKTTATVISQLFVRSTERAERIYAAMCARGWS